MPMFRQQSNSCSWASKRWASICLPLMSAGVFTGLWYLVSYVLIPDRVDFILPPLHEVIRKGILTWRNFKELLEGLWATTQVAMLGLTIATALGITLAVLMSQARWLEWTIFPYAVTLQAVPIVAIVPVIGLLLGYNFQSRVVVAVIITLFPIVSNTLFGIKCASRNLHDLFTLNRASRFARLWKLQLPASLPAMLTGFKISAGLCVVGTIVGEFFFGGGTVKGLGRLIREEYQLASGQGAQLYTAIFFCCALGLTLFFLFGLAERFIVRHRGS